MSRLELVTLVQAFGSRTDAMRNELFAFCSRAVTYALLQHDLAVNQSECTAIFDRDVREIGYDPCTPLSRAEFANRNTLRDRTFLGK
jgi:hypothetical protein